MGLSKSERNMLALLSMCRGISVTAVQYYRAAGRQNKRLFNDLEKLGTVAAEGLHLWKGRVVADDYMRLYALLEMFEKKTLNDDDKRIRVWTSATLSLVNEAIQFVTNPHRLAILQNLQRSIERVHAHVDRKGTYYEDYARADRAADAWRDIVENNWGRVTPSSEIVVAATRRLQQLKLQELHV